MKSDFHLSRSCEVGRSTDAKSVMFTSPAYPTFIGAPGGRLKSTTPFAETAPAVIATLDVCSTYGWKGRSSIVRASTFRRPETGFVVSGADTATRPLLFTTARIDALPLEPFALVLASARTS